MSEHLTVKRLSEDEAFRGLAFEWETLEGRLYPRTPFTSPSWNRLWWRHFARTGPFRRDNFFFHEVRDQDGQLIAVVPLMLTEEPAIGPIRLRKLQFLGRDPSLTEIRGIICEQQHEDDVIRALLRYFEITKCSWDIFQWSGVRVNSGGQKYLQSKKTRMERTLPDYIIQLQGGWAEIHSRLSNNTRKTIRKAREFLERDGYEVSLRITAPDDEPCSVVERFFALHAARSKAAEMKSHRDSFAKESHRNFLRDIATVVQPLGLVKVFELAVDGEVVASRLGFTLGEELYLYFSGYDPKWRKYGIMTTLVTEIIKWAIEHRFKIVNLSTGKDLSKLRWKPLELEFQDICQSSGSVRSLVAWQAGRWLYRRS